jgi:hypothetical protein
MAGAPCVQPDVPAPGRRKHKLGIEPGREPVERVAGAGAQRNATTQADRLWVRRQGAIREPALYEYGGTVNVAGLQGDPLVRSQPCLGSEDGERLGEAQSRFLETSRRYVGSRSGDSPTF